MKTSYIIKSIRDILGMSQTELAEQLGVSFATVNRWENGHCEPSKIATQAMKQLCSQRDIDYSQYHRSRQIRNLISWIQIRHSRRNRTHQSQSLRFWQGLLYGNGKNAAIDANLQS